MDKLLAAKELNGNTGNCNGELLNSTAKALNRREQTSDGYDLHCTDA